jgi:hypothetical protein
MISSLESGISASQVFRFVARLAAVALVLGMIACTGGNSLPNTSAMSGAASFQQGEPNSLTSAMMAPASIGTSLTMIAGEPTYATPQPSPSPTPTPDPSASPATSDAQ